ncbi:MAG: hypothetical protein M3R27_12475 [Bacteroidota bacterium]|nr:hypothetical protein [Bacteroidota bacterium]
MYAGKFGGIYLDKEVFDFLRIASEHWNEKFRVLVLTSHSKEEIQGFCKDSGLDPKYVLQYFVPHKLIPDYIGLGDFAITPVKPVPAKRYCTPIKDGEYWALGLPVVIPAKISDDSGIIYKYKIGSILEELNEEAYKKSVIEIDQLLKNNTRKELYSKIRPIAEKYRNFTIAENIYRSIYSKS